MSCMGTAYYESYPAPTWSLDIAPEGDTLKLQLVEWEWEYTTRFEPGEAVDPTTNSVTGRLSTTLSRRVCSFKRDKGLIRTETALRSILVRYTLLASRHIL